MVNAASALTRAGLDAELVGSLVIKVLTWLRNILTMLGTLTFLFLLTQDYSLTSSIEGSVGSSRVNSEPLTPKATLHLNGSVSPRPTAVLIPLDETTSSH